MQEIAAREDKVIATGHSTISRIGHRQSENVALLDLDATASLSETQFDTSQAVSIYGHVDVLISAVAQGRRSTTPWLLRNCSILRDRM